MKKLFFALFLAAVSGCIILPDSAAEPVYRNVAELDAFLETNRIDYARFKAMIDSWSQPQPGGSTAFVTNGVLVLGAPAEKK